MIEVTRLNGTIYFINPDMILTLEATPDTVVTLTSGEKLIVKESPHELIDRYVALKRRIACELPTVKQTGPEG
ncbi:MAG: flagellar FlbD family protein [Vampirovibrio sp.]|jgi:flagellar protein FlbD|nr:flagellar FlbD family protein [Vampirovibrio sp.]